MPITNVNAPDGSIIRVEHPEDADEKDIIRFASSKFKSDNEEIPVEDDAVVEPSDSIENLEDDIPEEDVGILRQMYLDSSSLLQEWNRGIADLIQGGVDLSKPVAENFATPVMVYGQPSAAGPSFLSLVTGDYAEKAKKFDADKKERIQSLYDKEFGDSGLISKAFQEIGIMGEEPEDPTFFQKTARVVGQESLPTLSIIKYAQRFRAPYNALKSDSAKTAAQKILGGLGDEFEENTSRFLAAEALATGGYVLGQDIDAPQWAKNTASIVLAGGFGAAPQLMSDSKLFSLPKNKDIKNYEEAIEAIATGKLEFKDFKPTKPKDTPTLPKDTPEAETPLMPKVVEDSMEFEYTRQNIAAQLAQKEAAKAIIEFNSHNKEVLSTEH